MICISLGAQKLIPRIDHAGSMANALRTFKTSFDAAEIRRSPACKHRKTAKISAREKLSTKTVSVNIFVDFKGVKSF